MNRTNPACLVVLMSYECLFEQWQENSTSHDEATRPDMATCFKAGIEKGLEIARQRDIYEECANIAWLSIMNELRAHNILPTDMEYLFHTCDKIRLAGGIASS